MITKLSLSSLLYVFASIPGVSSTDEDAFRDPQCDPKAFRQLIASPGINIVSTNATPRINYNTTNPIPNIPSVKGLDFCQVQVAYTAAGRTHEVRLEVWLPLTEKAWNGRYQATGGAGFRVGMGDLYMGQAIHDGYATSSTDGGNTSPSVFDISWALKADKTIDWELLHTAFTGSIVDQIILSRAIIADYYGESPHHSYWNGCSQGGRQGYMLAQQYPHLVDGILANAPAIGLTDIVMGDFWPQIVMKEAGVWMTDCQFNFFRQKAMEACDMLDGVSDGVISDPEICDFDPLHVVGRTYYCDGEEAEVTMAMANIVRRIGEGPRTPTGGPIGNGFRPSISMVGNCETSISTNKY